MEGKFIGSGRLGLGPREVRSLWKRQKRGSPGLSGLGEGGGVWDRRAFPAGMEGQSRRCPTKGGWGALKDRALRDASVLGDQPAVQDGWSMGAQETRRGGHSGVSGDQAAADALGPYEAFGLHPLATGREAGCKSG